MKRIKVFGEHPKLDHHPWECVGSIEAVTSHFRPIDRKRSNTDHDGHIYVLEFADGTIKVGVAAHPARRIAQHIGNMERYKGVKIRRVSVSRRHDFYRETERFLLGELKPFRISGEVFRATAHQVETLLASRFREVEHRATELGFASYRERLAVRIAARKADPTSEFLFARYIPEKRAIGVRPAAANPPKQNDASAPFDYQQAIETMRELIQALAAKQEEYEKWQTFAKQRLAESERKTQELERALAELKAANPNRVFSHALLSLATTN